MNKKYLWTALAIVLAVGIILTVILIATCKKDDNDDDGGNVPDDYIRTSAEFKTALDNQKNGDIIKLKNGTYKLQVVVTKNIKIIGESKDGVIINGPENYDDVATFEKVGNETLNHVGLLVLKDCNAEIRNVTLQGEPAKAGQTAKIYSNRYCGILIMNSNATIENVNVKDINMGEDKLGLQLGYSVYAVAPEGGNKSISIKNSKFENFNKGGVYIKENYNEFTFTGNEVKGYGTTDKISQNGLLFACKATITNNTFRNIKYDSATVWAVAIFAAYMTEATYDTCTISNNTFDNVQKENYELFNG